MTNKELEQKLNQLNETVMNWTKGLLQAPIQSVSKVEVSPEDKINRVLGGVSDPVPQDYRDSVNLLLNKDFGIHVKAQNGIPAFKFSVLVPKKYSKETDYDVRPKVISYADGLNGVKSWCERILTTFDESTKQQIISERILPQVNL